MARRSETVAEIPGRSALSVGECSMPAPPGWVWTKLTDIARLESGHTPSRSRPDYWDGGIPWIGIPDARENHGGTILATRQTVSQLGLENSAARLLPERTVCLSRTASIGYVTVMGRPMATSQDFVNWVCSPAIEPDYLKYLLLAESDALKKFSKGSTHSTIYFPEVEAFQVCLAPVNEQRRIVAKLEDLLARSRRAKEALDAVPPLLDKLRQSILAAAFRGDLTAEWRAKNPDVEPAENLLARIRLERRKKWEEAELAKLSTNGKPPRDDAWQRRYQPACSADAAELPELPSSWAWATAEELCAPGRPIIYGIIKAGPEYPGGVPYVRVTEVAAGRIDVDRLPRCDPQRAALFSRSVLAAGDLLVSKDGTIGKVAFVPPELEGGNINQHVLRVSPSSFVDRHFLARMIEAPNSQRWMTGETRGIALQGVNVEDFRRLPLPLAPPPEQVELCRRVNAALAGLNALAERLSATRAHATTLERALLARAFRGDLVPQEPTDEPAAEMLARLRADTVPDFPGRTSHVRTRRKKGRAA